MSQPTTKSRGKSDRLSCGPLLSLPFFLSQNTHQKVSEIEIGSKKMQKGTRKAGNWDSTCTQFHNKQLFQSPKTLASLMFPVADWFSAVAFPAQHFSVGKQCSHGKQGRGCADDVPWQTGNPSSIGKRYLRENPIFWHS